MAKIYLSPAAHANDNPTKCPTKCGENVHTNAYIDIVEKRLKELGFEVKRGDKSKTGSAAMKSRTAEANKWGADLYYVAHTNAGGGRYSVTYCYPNGLIVDKAAVLGKHRKALEAHNKYKWRYKTSKTLYEINATKMPCLYDELFFHDNAADCEWFHNGGMTQMAEETVQAFCELFGVTYTAQGKQETPEPAPATKAYKPTVKEWQQAAIADGFKFPKYGADGKWGSECEAVAKKAIVKKQLIGYKNKNLTKIVQKVVGVTADGKCGKGTDAAIRSWQKANGLTADGAVGSVTWHKMLNV